MLPPDDDIRAWVYVQVSEFDSAEDQDQVESQLAELLSGIGGAAGVARVNWSGAEDYNDLTAESAADVMSSVESWASVVSYAVARAYAPSSPWPKRLGRNLAGWGSKIVHLIQQLVGILLAPLAAAGKLFGAINYAIGLNFPWGVSVQLTWQ